MGNIFSVSFSGDAIVSGCWNSIIGTMKLQENHEALQTSLRELTARKNDVKTRVEVEEQQPFMKRSEHVQLWISRVETMEAQANQVVREGNQEIEKLCCGGYCSTNYMSSYKCAKKVAKMMDQVAHLKSEGVFAEVVQSLPAASANEVPVVPTVGMESTFAEAWKYIEGDQVRIIGLYGTGGVGKTTLLKQINNKFGHALHDFNLVIWVVVSQNHKLETIQDEIGEKIGLSGEWKKKERHGKAQDIFNVLNKKKFVLLLDDIWEPVDIIQVGVPIPDDQNKSKIIFTTRSEDVCGHMNAHKIKVDYLAWNKAWELFQKNVGTETLLLHPEILKLAEIVAKKCDGLPLALITMGKAMASKKTPEEWKYAIDVLKNSVSEFTGMEKVLHLLEYSYNNLPSEKVKSCFLYCALFPEDSLINKVQLSYCWMCEGILEKYGNVDKAKYESYDIIGTLLNACLLEAKDESWVKMHDVVREMALWLSRDPEKTNKNFLVKSRANLSEAPNVEEWKGVERVSLMNNHIENLVERPESPNLLTLFLQRNKLKKIGETFFDSMRSLQVLDLSWNRDLTQLPSGVSKLAFLQHLNLSGTGIRELPMELKALVRLKYLNLQTTWQLEFVPPHIISSFSMLKVLRMQGCGDDDKCPFDSEKAMLDELQCLKHLEVLTLTIRSTSCFQQLFSYKNLVPCTRELSLQLSDNTRFLDISSSLANLDYLEIEKCTDLEELKVNWEARGPNDPRESMTINQSCFVGLQSVFVRICPKMKDLTWLIFAPNLMKLAVARYAQTWKK